MTIRARQVKEIVKGCKSLPEFKRKFRHMLGTREDPNYNNPMGEQRLELDKGSHFIHEELHAEGRERWIEQKNQEIGTDEFSIRDLAAGFLGQEFVDELSSPGGLSSSRAEAMQDAFIQAKRYERWERACWNTARTKGCTLEEADKIVLESAPRAGFNSNPGGVTLEDIAPVGASVMDQINLFNATVGGLVERRLLDAYLYPDFIWRNFVEVQPSRANGGKMIGISYVGRYGRYVKEGEEYPNVGFNQLYVWCKPMTKYGMKISLTKEAIISDLTGELYARAESVGDALAYEKEYNIMGNVLGLNNIVDKITGLAYDQVGDSFVMGTSDTITSASTPNTTYQTTAVTTNQNCYNYVNKKTGVAFADWASVQAAQQVLNLVRDPVNQLPMRTRINTLLVDPFVMELAKRSNNATWNALFTGTANTTYGPITQAGGSTVPPVLTTTPASPSPLSEWTPYASNIVHQILLDAGVAEGFAAGQAQSYWLAGDPKKAFVWREWWDARVEQANPLSESLLSRDVVNEWVGSWAGRFVVREPRYVVELLA